MTTITTADPANLTPDELLARQEDIFRALARFGESRSQYACQGRSDRRVLRSALSSLLPGVAQPAAPAAIHAPVPPLKAAGAVTGASFLYKMPGRAKTGAQKPVHCQCGKCRWCLDNARWERIYDEKFADRSYYSRLVVGHNSALTEVR